MTDSAICISTEGEEEKTEESRYKVHLLIYTANVVIFAGGKFRKNVRLVIARGFNFAIPVRIP